MKREKDVFTGIGNLILDYKEMAEFCEKIAHNLEKI
jgi:hypothetical protein